MPTIQASDPIPISDPRDLFDPPLYNAAELHWIQEHVGEPPVVAFKETLPQNVNVKAVRPIVERVYELMELEKHEGLSWIGADAVKRAAQVYLDKSAEWADAHRRRPRSVPRFPSMYRSDSGRRMYKYGIGSDAGRVRSYEEDDERIYFAIALNAPSGEESVIADRAMVPTVPRDLPTKFEVDSEHGVIVCPVCKYSRNYDTGSNSAYNMARAQLARHLKNPKSEPDWHRAVYNSEFGS